MNIHQIQQHAKETKQYDSLEFIAGGGFINNPINCKFLDAYLNMILVDGIDGFITIRLFDEAFGNATCVPLEGKTDIEWINNK